MIRSQLSLNGMLDSKQQIGAGIVPLSRSCRSEACLLYETAAMTWPQRLGSQAHLSRPERT